MKKNNPVIMIFLVLIIQLMNIRAYAYIKSIQLDDKGRHETSLELDPYYSNIAYIYAFTEEPIPKIYLKDETNIYLFMIKNFYMPRYILFEASIYPFPIAGVYIKKHAPDFYNDSQFTPSFNLTRAITAGFPEPWAFSVFFGNVSDFVVGENKEVVGQGYSGLLVSYGNKHIADNILIDDHWLETEIKIKGADIRAKHNLSWSYALGIKLHRNEEIRDQLYVSIKRSRIDYIDEDIFFLWKFFTRNSEQEFRIDFDMDTFYKGNVTRYFFLMGKKFPVLGGKLTFAFSIGFLKTMDSAYTGSLESEIRSRWDIILRPNIHIRFD